MSDSSMNSQTIWRTFGPIVHEHPAKKEGIPTKTKTRFLAPWWATVCWDGTGRRHCAYAALLKWRSGVAFGPPLARRVADLEIEPCWAKFGQISAEMAYTHTHNGRSQAKFGKVCVNSGQHRPKFARCWATIGSFLSPNSAASDQPLPVLLQMPRPKCGRFGANVAGVGCILSMSTRIRPTSVQTRWIRAQIGPIWGRGLANLGQTWRISAQFWPGPESAHRRPMSARNQPAAMSTDVGLIPGKSDLCLQGLPCTTPYARKAPRRPKRRSFAETCQNGRSGVRIASHFSSIICIRPRMSARSRNLPSINFATDIPSAR